MIEWLGRISGSLESVSIAMVAGMSFFWWLSGVSVRASLPLLERQLSNSIVMALLVFVAMQLLQVPVQFVTVAGSLDAALQSPAQHWLAYVTSTRPGLLLLARTVAGSLLLVFIVLLLLARQRAPMSSGQLCLVWGASALLIGSGALAGHYAGDEDAAYLVAVHAVHMIAASLWAGSLPLWWLTVRAGSRQPEFPAVIVTAVRRFSRAAMVLVGILVAAGLLLADQFIGSQGDLLATPWGMLVAAKVVLLSFALLAANSIRKTLPDWSAGMSAVVIGKALRSVGVEAGVVLVILVLAANLGQITPALHVQSVWWLPFRLSFDAIAPNKVMVQTFWVALSVAVVALFALALLAWRRSGTIGIVVCALVLAGGGGTAVWVVTVPAFPDTFRRSDVAYLSESIANGARLFRENCTACHGTGGHGSGPLSTLTQRPPADFSAPHTALHTAGDMYWWIGNGIAAGGMPGFPALSDEDRWDLVNFLRVFSQGFQARLLSQNITPEKSWLGAPDIYLVGSAGELSQLKALRGTPVLLVFEKDGQDRMSTRLPMLAEWRRKSGRSLALVHIATGRPSANWLPPGIWQAQSPQDVMVTYEFLTRTLPTRGETAVLGVPRAHAEFLLDRYGYIRARWVPEEEPDGWASPDALGAELDKLAAETRIPPPPDDHIH